MYEQKLIRLIDDQGNAFTGLADTFPAEYGLHEYGTEEEGVQWDENLTISDSELHRMGKRIPMTMDDFRTFASERIINAAEAAEIFFCWSMIISFERVLLRMGK